MCKNMKVSLAYCAVGEADVKEEDTALRKRPKGPGFSTSSSPDCLFLPIVLLCSNQALSSIKPSALHSDHFITGANYSSFRFGPSFL